MQRNKQNKELFDKFTAIVKETEDSFGTPDKKECFHMGYFEVGQFIDWLEGAYTLEKKGN